MDFVDAYFFTSPAVFVAAVTLAFLASRAWPRLSKQKQTDKLSYHSITKYQASDLSVSKEPEVPEGWWSSREEFELERRAIFSQVMETRPHQLFMFTNRASPGYILLTLANSQNRAPTSPLMLLDSRFF